MKLSPYSRNVLAPVSDPPDIVELLRERAARQPFRRVYTFLADADVEDVSLTFAELDCKARAIAVKIQELGVRELRVLLLFPPGLDYITAFFGCLYAGAIAIPAYPPRPNRTLARLQAIARDSQATVAMTTAGMLSKIERFLPDISGLTSLRWLTTDDLDDRFADEWKKPSTNADSVAFLQYTSGSTATPKGVMISHGNLLHNERLIQQAFLQNEESVIVGWLPLYHDMGLIGQVLQPVYSGSQCVLMSPGAFLQQPYRWLRAITLYKATTSGGPNFAYDLCVRRISNEQRLTLDLSSWALAFNGAEPVRAETMDRFAAAFEPCGFRREALYSCYGLAEATLFVSGGPAGAGPVIKTLDKASLEQNRVVTCAADSPDAKKVVSCGEIAPESKVIVVDPKAMKECPPGEVGEIWIQSKSKALGYWNLPKETAEIFQAYLLDTGEGPFLRTGDLGFIEEGSLFITGRIKDLLIFHGRNHYPQDIELTVERSHPSLRAGCAAVFSVEDGDQQRLVIVQELDHRAHPDFNEVFANIIQQVSEIHELQVHSIALIKAGSILKTSSGKIRRSDCREAYQSSALETIQEWRRGVSVAGTTEAPITEIVRIEEIEAWLTLQLSSKLGMGPAEIDITQPLARYGIDSIGVIEFLHLIETHYGLRLDIADAFAHSSIEQMAMTVFAGRGRTSLPADYSTGSTGAAISEHPLSRGQEAMLFLQHLAPESPAYNIATALRIRAELDIEALRRSFEALIDRHACLRTTFLVREGKAVQCVHERVEVSFKQEDASGFSDDALKEWLTREARRPFDLEKGPLLRVTVLVRSKQELIVQLVLHHIIIDFWSLSILARELGELYSKEKNGLKAELLPLDCQFADYARWQSEMLAGESGTKLWDYWHSQLAGKLPVLNLRTDRPRSRIQTYDCKSQSLRLDEKTTRQLKLLGLDQDATLYTTLLATFQILLHRYTRQEDILVGSPTANRTQANQAGIIGYFANMVVLRADLSGDPSFIEFLDRTRHTVLDAMQHQDYPFGLLVERLQPERDPSRHPIFQVVFVMQQPPRSSGNGLTALALNQEGAKVRLGEVEAESVALDDLIGQFDLILTAADIEGELRFSLTYNSQLFNTSTISRLLGHFETLLKAIATSPDQPISRLPILTGAERSHLTSLWETNGASYQENLCVHQLFESQVARAPGSVALRFQQQELTYFELNRQANHLGHYLRRLNVGPESLAAVCLDRSPEMIIALLGILKAGGAYLPLDPAYPKDRLAFMLEDATPDVVLTCERLLDTIPETEARVICLDSDWESIASNNDENPLVEVSGDNLAYVIYTSGSTGRPKGALVTHSNVARLLAATHHWFNFNEKDVWTLFHSYAFDFSVWELWGALAYGGRLVVVPYLTSRSPDSFYELLVDEQVTVLNQTPSAFRQLIRAEEYSQFVKPLNLRLVIFGGEALELQSLKPWFDRHGDQQPQLVNMYGITETTVHVTYRPINEADLSQACGSVIGEPIPDLQIFLLDHHLQPVPIGIAGEIHVGGDGLARGYLNRPALTAERFIPNPFTTRQGARLYRTGDLGRFLPDGDIEYLGRIDHQVKIRGFRIELGEIESTLIRHPAVREAVAVVWEDSNAEDRSGSYQVREQNADGEVEELRRFLKGGGSEEGRNKKEISISGEKRLVAYVVRSNTTPLNAGELREYLKEKLPDYMVPSAFIILDALPLNSNGKIDRRALPQPVHTRPETGKEYVPPTTAREKTLADIWADVLGIERVGVQDNFFELGGDSIRSIQVRSKAQQKGLNFSLQQLFEHQTIYELSQILRASEPNLEFLPETELFSLISPEDRSQVPDYVEDAYPLARIQSGIIFHCLAQPASPMYHDIFVYQLRARFNEKLFKEVSQRLFDRHPILRTSFDLTGFSRPLQLVHERVEVPFQVIDFRGLSGELQREAQEAWVEAEKERSFDWSQAPLIRIYVHWLTDDTFDLVLSFHDLILDGWSTASILTELLNNYFSLLKGKRVPVELPPEIAYRDFIALEQMTIESGEVRRFWDEALKDVPVTMLPRWGDKSRKNLPRIGVLDVPMTPESSGGLKKIAVMASVPLKDVLLAVHVKVLSILNGHSDVLTGLESNGRLETTGGERSVGMHLNTAPFRLKLPEGTWVDLVRETFKTERILLPYRRYPLAELQKGRSGQPLFETVFNYTHFHVFEQLQNIEGLQILGARGFEETHFTLRAEFNQNAFSGMLQLDLACNLSEICREQLESIGGYYTKTILAMTRDPFARHDSQSLLPKGETDKFTITWNDTEREVLDRRVHELFEEQVERSPDAIAVRFEGVMLNYSQLNRRANQLARHLRSLGVTFETPVGICTERSPEMVVALLAVLKAGGAYLPLDPSYPRERLAFMFEDSRMPVMLTQERLKAALPATGARIVSLDTDWNVIEKESDKDLSIHSEQENLAYVIYTSGSTGKPKGVQISHCSLVNLLCAIQNRLQLTDEDTLLAVTTLSFDIAGLEIFLPLIVGARLEIVSHQTAIDGFRLLKSLETSDATVMQATPATWRLLLESGWQGNKGLKVLCGGEALSQELADRLLEKGGSLWNLYGPTETTIWSMARAIASLDNRITIGRPIDNTRVYVLNRSLHPVPIGTPGELHIGGTGLARGYSNSPELTADRFVPDPFSETPGARLYKTGDLAHYLPNGEIEYLGRLDQQVKIRGHRIELEEIEAALRNHEAIKDAAVVVTEQSAGLKHLAAYIVLMPGSSIKSAEIRSFLMSSLPAFMVPSSFTAISHLPLTPNGKTDRKQLLGLKQNDPDMEDMARLLRAIDQLSQEETKALLSEKKLSFQQT